MSLGLTSIKLVHSDSHDAEACCDRPCSEFGALSYEVSVIGAACGFQFLNGGELNGDLYVCPGRTV